MDVLLTVLGLVAGLVLLLVAAAVVRVVRLRRQHRRRVAELRPEHTEQAVLFAVASDRQTQVRGIGSLLLGPEHLAFVTLVAGRDVVVPRDTVTSASVSRTFMGRSSGQDLLVVTWEREGLGDAAAFQVGDPAAWRERLV
ncbi:MULTISPECIES: hypothetical protein [unclassified Aeromicrobium]|uniref:hypothetical protein n=1 Tax=unclassified Aeromicrobium TaxID=2633570 RepID=UPI0006FEF1DE|nr:MULTISPECIES: hypothetical protein [unclassified Aeromicrobium]KQO39152.1 hypothetical protein ASF05_04660 [Aeromicrobium sp. Leaf245]KQP28720.1 hypothetical protein ASF38_16725 [Aeromicrobium sp. Leaf272]KQP79499.1 hypothetical protein ASF37_00235 [Aeromicrobium sp. Leaf289]KQP82418.1 hypothetical protein ASF35_13480 [Aeromicrobium sp. Leaf291]